MEIDGQPVSDYVQNSMEVLDELLKLRREKFRLLDKGGSAERIWEIDRESDALRKKIM